jgi:integrase
MPLNDTFLRRVKHSGAPAGDKHTDSAGMHLLVKAAGKYWRLNYRFDGKQKTLALGVYPTISLQDARARRDAAKKLLANGIDPSKDKAEQREARVRATSHSFEAVARAWLAKTAANRAATTQEKNTNWLERNIFPEIGTLPIADIGPRDVLAALAKIEARGAVESAHKIKQLCGQIFRFAIATGLSERDVTVDLRGALAAIPRNHYAAITEPDAAGALLRSIDSYTGHPYAVAALKLAPLVFVRPGELRAAEWPEFDLDAGEWRIPAEKMKMRTDHLVPLATQAVTVLRAVQLLTGAGRYVFPSIRTNDRCMSENTVNAALRNLGYDKEQMTGHGFRAMARTMLDEVLGERVDLIEHQLAHQVKDANGRAYNRTAHLPARREMMQRWADYLDLIKKTNG